MESKFTIKRNSKEKFCVTMHPATASKMGFSNKQKLSLSFGVRSYQTIVRTSTDADMQEVLLGSEPIRSLMIPIFYKYELLVKKNNMIIGPFIGILESRSGLEKASQLVSQYDKVGGAVLAFTESGINPAKQTITGLMFNPKTRKWVQGEYAYPASLFKKVPVSQQTRNHLYGIIGRDRIFNTPITNKWEMHQLLVSLPELKIHMPDTILYKDPKDVRALLDKYGQVYIKPIVGMRGIGILKASKIGKQIQFQYREEKRNHELSFTKGAEAEKYIAKKLISGGYMVQQAVNQIYEEKRIVDFRLTVVINGTGEWEEVGFYARYAPIDSIVSNVTEGGKSVLGEAALKNILKLSNSQTYQLKMRMSNLGMKVAKSFNASGSVHYGNLGFDLALDISGQMWILEVNRDPGFITPIRAQAQLTNMLYAKRLALLQ